MHSVLSLPTFIVFLAVVIMMALGDSCSGVNGICDQNRPPGNNDPYRFECQSLGGQAATSCGLWCAHCTHKCDDFSGFFPEHSKINCDAKVEEEKKSGGLGGTLETTTIIIIVVAVLACVGLCTVIPACVFCCRQNRNRYPNNVPMMTSPGMGYASAGYGASPMMMMGGGGPSVTTSYSTMGMQQSIHGGSST